MRRFVHILAAVSAFAMFLFVNGGCSRMVEDGGMVSIGLSADGGDIEILTRGVSELTDDFTVVIDYAAGGNYLTRKYSEVKEPFIMPEGDYKIYVYNITESQAVEGNGAVRYYGSSTFSVTAGNITNVNFTAAPVNTKVSVTFSDSFKSAFTSAEGYLFETSDVNRTRRMNFDLNSTLESPYMFFNIDSDPQITVVVSGVTASGEGRSYIKKVALVSGRWEQITINDK